MSGMGSDIGGAVGDIAEAAGDFMAAGEYQQAAKYAKSNAAVAQRSGVIQQEQTNRQIYQTISGQGAVEAAGGTGAGGSNQYLARASQQQGGLQRAIVANNATLQVQGFEAEASADTAQSDQATAQGVAAAAKGAGSIIDMLI
jgi:hypothetical protein